MSTQDYHGNELKLGDLVYIPCRVIGLYHYNHYTEMLVRTEYVEGRELRLKPAQGVKQSE